MEQSILKSTKKVLGLDSDYTVFDHDVILYINSVFSTLNQLGIGPVEGFSIDDDTALWGSYAADYTYIGLIKTYMYLRVRFLFDPPSTSFLVEAINRQILECEWRLNVFREEAL